MELQQLPAQIAHPLAQGEIEAGPHQFGPIVGKDEKIQEIVAHEVFQKGLSGRQDLPPQRCQRNDRATIAQLEVVGEIFPKGVE